MLHYGPVWDRPRVTGASLALCKPATVAADPKEPLTLTTVRKMVDCPECNNLLDKMEAAQ